MFRWRRGLGFRVALQVRAWIVGDLLFTWVPFQAWVRGGEVLNKPHQVWLLQWAQALPPADPASIEAVARTFYKGEAALSGVSRIEQASAALWHVD